MSEIFRIFESQGYKSKMLLQVHDELVFDLHRDEADVIPPIVREAMANAIDLDVPIEVDIGVGDNWLDAH